MKNKHFDKKAWLSRLNILLGGVLVLLGFNSCFNAEDEPLLYGCPFSPHFELKGTITDHEGKPVQSAVAKLQFQYHDAQVDTTVTVMADTTKADGTIQFEGTTFHTLLYAATMDGEEQKEYLTKKEFSYGPLFVVVEDTLGVLAPDTAIVKMTVDESDPYLYAGETNFTLHPKDDTKE